MADYLVGKKPGQDRYMVGQSSSKQSSYKVGGGGAQVSQADNKTLGGGALDPVVGSKSAFSYGDSDKSYKDVGDSSDNMNFGGSIDHGTASRPTKAGGEIDLVYSEKGDWDDKKNAMSRRKAMMENAKKYYSTSEFNTPTDDVYPVKK